MVSKGVVVSFDAYFVLLNILVFFVTASPVIELKHHKDMLRKTAVQLGGMQEDIKFLKESYHNKLEDILLESIVTQEELAVQKDINLQKDELIASQKEEIAALKEALSLLHCKYRHLEDERACSRG